MSEIKPRPIKTGISFTIRSNVLSVDQVSETLGVHPTRAFEKGDPYTGKKKVGSKIVPRLGKRPSGVWQYSTEESVHTDVIDDHMLYLLQALEPASTEIRRFCDDVAYFVIVRIWHVGDASFGMSSGLVRRISELCEEIGIVCWTPEEAA